MSESNFGGIELAGEAINIFYRWHDMIVFGGPVCAIGRRPDDVSKDKKVIENLKELGERIVEVMRDK